MTNERIMRSVVLMAVLIAAALATLGLFGQPAVVAQVDEPPPAQGDLQAAPLANGVDPFAMTMTPSKDAWVNEASPSTNYGADLELTLRIGSHPAHALLGFDLSVLPADAEVVSATLSVYSSDTLSGPYPIRPYAITSSWRENMVTWNNQPPTSDRGDPKVPHVPEGWTVFDVTNLVRDWHDGSLAIYGIELVSKDPASGSRTYKARNTATPPELTVHYTRRAELVPMADTWVGYAEPDTPHGSYPSLNVWSENHTEEEAFALLGFDFALLPPDIAVISATLALRETTPNRVLSGEDATLVADVYADAIVGNWLEATTTWNTRPPSTPLGDPPAEVVFNDYAHWDVTNIVQSWADDLLDPYGILLRVGPETSNAYGFKSREQLADPPRLVIAYGAAPPDCKPITAVQVNGASAGVTEVEYTFEAVYFPADADPPYNILWSATDHGTGQYGPTATFSWASAGEKVIHVEVTHCSGATFTDHTITISDPPSGCDHPVAGVTLSGPMVVGRLYPRVFSADALPYNATLPMTFTWEATGWATDVMTVSERTTDKTYAWPYTGSKTISVTAENCVGSAVAYHAVEVVYPADLPDLLISTAWIDLEEDRIGYVIHNQGDTAVPAGFSVALEVDHNPVATAEHPQPLGAGGIGVGYLDYAWTCAGAAGDMGVVADWAGQVDEVDESNNEWNETRACDQRPPEIVTGPEIVDITETTARVTWATDEACVGWVKYDTSPDDQNPYEEQESTSYLTNHSVTLHGLTAATDYYARAFCEDAAGLRVNSAPLPFETAPEGTDPPVIHRMYTQQYPSEFYEFWEVYVEVEDGSYMDRVSCSLDGTPLGIDYSADTSGDYPRYSLYLSPYDMGLSRDQFFGQSYPLSCTAYRQDPTAYTTLQQDVWFNGDSAPPLRVWIIDPPPGHTVYVLGQSVPSGTTLDVMVDAAAHEWGCTDSVWSENLPPGVGPVGCDYVAPVAVDTIELWVDSTLKDIVTDPSQLVNTLTADLGGLALGDYEIRVVATMGSGTIEESRPLHVEQGEPSLEVTRSIRREGNTLEVTLDLYNAGSVDTIVAMMEDPVYRLQPILKYYDLGDVRYEVEIADVGWFATTAGRDLDVRINFNVTQPDGQSFLVLAPGESVSVGYVLVPELHDIDFPPRIGIAWDCHWSSGCVDRYLQVWVYEGQQFSAESFDLSATLVDDPSYGLLPLEDAIANAIRQADYVIVTAPHFVYAYLTNSYQVSADPDAEWLFSNMAELASLENGVLGMLSWNRTQPLDDLLEPGNGSWADRLNPSFNEVDEGYVLIVGETEIVASHYAGGDNFTTYVGIPDHVHDSDLWYADTAGSTARPELVVGRVVGNDLTVLNTYLDNIIRAARGEAGYGFNRSWAYVCNGNGDGEDWFQEDADEVDDQLDVRYDDSTWKNFIGEDGEEQKALHLQYMPNRDLILYRGHGSSENWDDGFRAAHVLDGIYDFGSTNPAMLAAACTTGNYEIEDDLNLSEALLWRGAGAYVGATEKSERWANSDAFVNFIPKWQADESMGQALNQLKRAIWEMEWAYDNRKLWAFEYNLYGDPKYGRMDTLASAASASEETTLSVTAAPQGVDLKVILPELESNQAAGDDLVRIPGGGMLAELGAYPVPVWTLSMDFRPGRQVQDVQLTVRSNLVVTGSLSLPQVVAASDCGCAADELPAPAGPPPAGWYPEMDRVFDWSVERNPNGGSTLEIVLYPFYYHGTAGDALYYRTYQLAVETFDSPVEIESLEATGSGYEPRDAVILEMVLDATGSPQDVLVVPSVRTRGTNKVLGGIPMKTLHNLVGTATVELTWDTRPYGAGDYQVVVELRDSRGLRLDTAVAEVRLGTVGARVSSLASSQAHFAPGDLIGLSLGVQNTGTVPIDGTAVFLVQRSEDLSATEVITMPINDLAPGASRKMITSWDTTGAVAYRYRVLGYFKFFSQATEPRVLYLYRPRVFLPVVMRKE
jgi:hypothetical protein